MHPVLYAELRPDAEGAAVRLLADEGEPHRPQLARDALEPLGGSGEVGAAQVARAGSRAVGGVRDADPFLEEGELLGGLVEAGRQLRRMEKPPEVVARVGEVRAGGGGHATRVDADEDDAEIRREHVRHVAPSHVSPGHVL